ncbi:MAG: hypothetical protein Q8T08_22975, partial [Ignavibacteria bacterium]|nr:hypothetical protein [Ignavibacteria bacterium]
MKHFSAMTWKLVRTLLGLIVIIFCVVSCKSTKQINTVKPVNQVVHPILNIIQPISLFDPNESSDTLSIENVLIENGALHFDIAYAGGCGDVELSVFYEEIDSDDGSYVQLKPVFTDQDPCRSNIVNRFSFDLGQFESRARAGGFAFKIENYGK